MYEDDPQDQIHDLCADAIFPDQPLGRPVIGTSEVVGALTRDEVDAYHRQHYAAPNIVLAAAGNVDHDHLMDLAERLFADLADAHVPAPVAAARPGSPRLVLKEKATEQYHLCLGGPGLTRNDPRRHAQGVLDTVLGGSMSSRLFQEVREKRGLAYSVGSYTVGYADAGQVGVYLGTREDNLATACRVIGDQLRRLAEEPLGAAELQRAKDHLRGRLVLSMESSAGRMNRIGRTLLTGTEMLSIDELIARIDAVQAADVQALAQEFWQPQALSVAAIGPQRGAIEAGVRELTPALAGG